MESQNIPLPLQQYAILIVDSKIKRELVHSAYNDRRASCEEAVKQCQKTFPNITALRDLDMTMLQKCQQNNSSAEYWQRARHVISENQRVLTSVKKLQQHAIKEFGELLYASHASLKNDYATSCPELDFIVDTAQDNGALGARITGAGFGGCAVILDTIDHIATVQENISTAYAQRFNTTPTFILLTDNLEATCITPNYLSAGLQASGG